MKKLLLTTPRRTIIVTSALCVLLLGCCLFVGALTRPFLSSSPDHATPSPRAGSGTGGLIVQHLPTPTPTALLSTPYQPLVWQGNSRLPEIALTFDDGPSPIYTRRVLHILQRYHIHATFFCIGEHAQSYPYLVKEEYDDGEIIGDHTWDHPALSSLTSKSIYNELRDTARAIEHATGRAPAYFRPPYGAYSATVLAQARKLGLTGVMWNVDPRDWARPGTSAIISNVLTHARNGAIILMHDGGGDREQTIAALPTIIERLHRRGFRLVTIPELIHDMNQQARSATPTATPDHEASTRVAVPHTCTYVHGKRRCRPEARPSQNPPRVKRGSWLGRGSKPLHRQLLHRAKPS